MGPAGPQADFHQTETVCGSLGLIVQYGLLNALFQVVDDIRFPFLLIPQQQVRQRSGRLRRHAVNHGQIRFIEPTVPDLGRQGRSNLRRTGQDHYAADHPVQPVDRPDTVGVQRRPHQLRHPARLVGGQDPGGLDGHAQMVIHIQKLHAHTSLGRSSRMHSRPCQGPGVRCNVSRMDGSQL